jgi:hypothetical protein
MQDELNNFYKEYAAWDPMLVKQGDHWFLYVMAARKGVDQESFFIEQNHIHGFSSTDLKHWVDLGVIVGLPADSGRLCAGNVILVDGKFYFFFSCTIKQLSMDSLDQRIFLATSMDGKKFVLNNQFSLPPDPELYKTRRVNPETGKMMFAWRDPFCFQDPLSGNYYLFICCGGFRWGVPPNIAIGVADKVAGPYTLIPEAVKLTVAIEDTLVMPVSEIERVQVLFRNGRYFIIFSAWKRYVNEAFFRSDPGVDADITDSTIYILVSDNIEGPYRVYTKGPVVQGSKRTGMYGTCLLQVPGQEDAYYAHGWYPDSFRVDVSGRYKCKWDGEKLVLS